MMKHIYTFDSLGNPLRDNAAWCPECDWDKGRPRLYIREASEAAISKITKTLVEQGADQKTAQVRAEYRAYWWPSQERHLCESHTNEAITGPVIVPFENVVWCNWNNGTFLHGSQEPKLHVSAEEYLEKYR